VKKAHRSACGRFAALAAIFAGAGGDAANARRLAALSRTCAAPRPQVADDSDESWEIAEMRAPWEPARAAETSAAVELALGDEKGARERLHDGSSPFAEYSRVGVVLAYLDARDPKLIVDRYVGWNLLDPDVTRGFTLVAEGDGVAVANWLRRPSAETGAFLRLGAPLLKSGKEDLLHWIRLGHRMPGWTRSPAAQMVHWTELSAAACALGDAELGAELGRRAARFREAILDRKLGVPLAVIERL
jgi:hypothetical protein